MMMPLIDVLEIQQIIFEGGEINVCLLPLSYHFLIVFFH